MNYINYLYPLSEVFSEKAVSIDYVLGGVPPPTEIFICLLNQSATSLKLHFNEKDGKEFQSVTGQGLFMKNGAATSVSLLPFTLPLPREMNYTNVSFLLTDLYFVNSNTPDPLWSPKHSRGCARQSTRMQEENTLVPFIK